MTRLTLGVKNPWRLSRKGHFLEKLGVSRVVAQICEQGVSLDLGQSGVSLVVGTLQPFK